VDGRRLKPFPKQREICKHKTGSRDKSALFGLGYKILVEEEKSKYFDSNLNRNHKSMRKLVGISFIIMVM